MARDVNMARAWSQGCQCHNDQRVEVARNGMTFNCPNNRKGMRRPFWAARLAEAQARWRTNRHQARLGRGLDPGGSVYAGIHAAYSKLISFVGVRFGYVLELPWALWECRSRTRAAELMAVYTNNNEAYVHQHRVTEFWLGVAT